MSSPEAAVEAVTSHLRKKGIYINAGLIKDCLEKVSPSTCDVIYFDHENVYEQVIAALCWDACTPPRSIRPIIFIADEDAYRAVLMEGLNNIISAAHTVKVLPKWELPLVRMAPSQYLCQKRYNSLLGNGNVIGLPSSLHLDTKRYPKEVLENVCVRGCSANVCSMASICRYAWMVKYLKDGKTKFQIYTTEQHQMASKKRELPQRCINIGVPRPVMTFKKHYSEHVLRKQDLKDYARLSVKMCHGESGIKIPIINTTRRLEELTDLIFDKLQHSGGRSPKLREWLIEVLAVIEEVKKIAGGKLMTYPSWIRIHRRLVNTVTHLLTAEHPFENVKINIINAKNQSVTVRIPEPEKVESVPRVCVS